MKPAAGHGRRRWLAHPVLSALIAATWLALHGSLAPAHLLWAAAMGLGLPWLVHGFLAPARTLRGGAAALRLLFVVAWDIVVANFTVARLVLHPGVRPRPAWVRVRHGFADPRGAGLLATIITMTPGTVSAVVDETQGEIVVHVLDTADPQAVAADILQRYGRPLKEIFE